MMKRISLLAAARLELQGAEQRLARAERDLSDFHLEHDGRTYPSDLLRSIAHEREMLETEFDAARRRRDECAMHCKELSMEE